MMQLTANGPCVLAMQDLTKRRELESMLALMLILALTQMTKEIQISNPAGSSPTPALPS